MIGWDVDDDDDDDVEADDDSASLLLCFYNIHMFSDLIVPPCCNSKGITVALGTFGMVSLLKVPLFTQQCCYCCCGPQT